jgi:lipoprotein NlpI
LLFGLHPLHTESVAWVSERKDLLCGFFFLLALLSYIRYGKGAEGHVTYEKKVSRRYYFFALGFLVLALLSKPMAVTFPVVILLLDWYPLQRLRPLKRVGPVLIEKIPFLACSLLSAAVTFAAQNAAGATMPSQSAPLMTRILVACKAVVSYLAKMVLPLDLSPFYPYPQETSLLSPQFLGPVVAIIVITAAAVASAGRQRLWLAVWAYYLVTLLPVLGVIQVGLQSMADRYFYLPSLGPFLLLGLAVSRGYDKLRQGARRVWAIRLAVIVPCALVFAGLSYGTVRQIGIWKDSLALWNSVIRNEPGKVFFAYMNRGIVFDEEGRYDLALADYAAAAGLNPQNEKIYNNRAIVLNKMGYPDMAIEDCDRALSINPHYAEAYNNRGIAYATKGMLEKAIEDYGTALAEDPRYLKALINRGNAFGRKGLLMNAIEDYTQALAMNPRYANAYLSRGLLYYRTGNIEHALSDLRRSCRLGNRDACTLVKESPPTVLPDQ